MTTFTPAGYALGHIDGPMPEGTPTTRQLFGARTSGQTTESDLSGYVDRVRNQSPLQSCVGMSFARDIHVRAQIMKFGQPNPGAIPYPSELGIYTLGREEMGGPLQDGGSVPALVRLALEQDIGVPLERDWPFDPDKVNVPLPVDVLARALAYKFTGLFQIVSVGQGRVDDIVQALAENHPVEIAIPVGPEYEGAGAAPVAPASQVYGSHSISILGAKRANGRWLFLNCGSWGPGWALNGYAWLDQDVITDRRAYASYCVTVAPNL
jgi:hypothetical protein